MPPSVPIRLLLRGPRELRAQALREVAAALVQAEGQCHRAAAALGVNLRTVTRILAAEPALAEQARELRAAAGHHDPAHGRSRWWPRRPPQPQAPPGPPGHAQLSTDRAHCDTVVLV